MVAYRTAGAPSANWHGSTARAPSRGVVGEPTNTVLQPRVSPDGRRVAVVSSVQDNGDIWLLDGARASRFTFDAGQEHFHVWSPDSTRMVYRSPRGTSGALYSKLTSGAGVEEELLRTDQSLAPTSWSADGRFLLYLAIDPETNADLWVLPMSGQAEDRKPFVFLKTPFREAYGTFSPDGRWVAYHSNESGRPEIYVRPFIPPGATGTAPTAAGGQWQVSAAGGIHPLWRSDGKELYYIKPDGAMMAAPITVTRNYSGAGRARRALSDAHLRRRRGYPTRTTIRRHRRRAVPHQHGAERGRRADHAAAELESRREEMIGTSVSSRKSCCIPARAASRLAALHLPQIRPSILGRRALPGGRIAALDANKTHETKH